MDSRSKIARRCATIAGHAFEGLTSRRRERRHARIRVRHRESAVCHADLRSDVCNGGWMLRPWGASTCARSERIARRGAPGMSKTRFRGVSHAVETPDTGLSRFLTGSVRTRRSRTERRVRGRLETDPMRTDGASLPLPRLVKNNRSVGLVDSLKRLRRVEASRWLRD